MKMEPDVLRGLLHERTHHTIEVPLYPTLLKWRGQPIHSFGEQAQMCYEVWRDRGLTDTAENIQWVKTYLAIAEQVRAGKKPDIDEPLPTPFTITIGGRIMAVPVHPSVGEFEAGAPSMLFQTPSLPKKWNLYDVSPDGQRFLLNLPLELTQPTSIAVVTNWSEKRKRPAESGQ